MNRQILFTMLSLSAQLCNAENIEFQNFLVKKPHDVGFYGCDYQIKDAFSAVNGTDIRVKTDYFPELKKDSIKLTATWGSLGDTVFSSTEFRKFGGKCYWTRTGIITTTKSCSAYSSDRPEYKYTSEVGDIIWMENEGNVTMHLKPLNGGCVAVYQMGYY